MSAATERAARLENAITDSIGRLSVISLAFDNVAEAAPVFTVGPCHVGGDWVITGLADDLKDAIASLSAAVGFGGDPIEESQTPAKDDTA